MAGSFNYIVDYDGSFRMDLIENTGDAHEALEECFDIIHNLVGGDLKKVPAWRDEVPPRFTGWHADQCEPCRGSGFIPPGKKHYSCVTCGGSGHPSTKDAKAEMQPQQVVAGTNRHNLTDRALEMARDAGVKKEPGTQHRLSEHFSRIFPLYCRSLGTDPANITTEILVLFEAMRDTLVEAERRAGL